MSFQLTGGRFKAFDSFGAPLVGGQLLTFAGGTTTPKVTYTDATLATPNPTTIALDARGEAQVWLGGGAYTFTLKDAVGVLVWTVDGVVDPADTAAVALAAFQAALASSNGGDSVGSLAPFTGAIKRTQAAKNADTLSVLEFSGVDPTGTADSTAGIQAAITAARAQGGDQRILLWRKGTYKVTAGLSTGSNIAIVCEPGVIINFTGDVNTSLFNASNQTGFYFHGNGATINGNRAGVTLSDGGNQNCFYLYGSDNVLIEDVNISGFAFDGITITGDSGDSGPCTNVRVVDCDVYNCGRNGLSIIHANGVQVLGGRYRNSNGTPSGPWAGIDVEPNGGEFAKAIFIAGVLTESNNGAGLLFVPVSMSNTAGLTYDVTVIGGRSINDGLASSGATGIPALFFSSGGAFTNEVGGQVTVRDFVIEGPGAMGVKFKNWDASKAPRVLLDNVLVINPNANAASTGTPNQCGFVVYCDSSQAVSTLGKIMLRGCKAEDNRGSPVMILGGYMAADSGKTVQNVVWIDFEAVNTTGPIKPAVKADMGAAGTLVDAEVVYTNPRAVSTSGSISDGSWAGQRVNFTAVSSFTLPLASKCKGLYYEVQNDPAAGGNSTVTVSGSDHIKSNGVAAASSFTLQPGDIARFRSEGGTYWSAAAVA